MIGACGSCGYSVELVDATAGICLPCSTIKIIASLDPIWMVIFGALDKSKTHSSAELTISIDLLHEKYESKDLSSVY